jgi:hypothetical protein
MNFFFKVWWDFDTFFSQIQKKNPLYELHWISFLSPSGKILPKEEKKKLVI